MDARKGPIMMTTVVVEVTTLTALSRSILRMRTARLKVMDSMKLLFAALWRFHIYLCFRGKMLWLHEAPVRVRPEIYGICFVVVAHDVTL